MKKYVQKKTKTILLCKHLDSSSLMMTAQQHKSNDEQKPNFKFRMIELMTHTMVIC